MSIQDVYIIPLVLAQVDFNPSIAPPQVNNTLGLNVYINNFFRTLTTGNYEGDDSEGLLYVPSIDGTEGCGVSTGTMVPSNVTTSQDFPTQRLPLMGLMPWNSSAIQCTEAYLHAMENIGVQGALVYQPGSGVTPPPSAGDPSWNINDTSWLKGSGSYPIVAISPDMGSLLMTNLALYSGNISTAPNGATLTQVYGDRNDVRLYARMDYGSPTNIPSLWIFLIIVLAILLAIVLSTSVVMHLLQRRNRLRLQRRVANGEVDLEVLGIKRINVPQEALDKMPLYVYAPDSKTGTSASTPQVQFSQTTCPICLDDFVQAETSVRELPCKHIFHPDCIDPFLRDTSSLCPVCKKSALPAGYQNIQITNLMVRRERLMRRMRDRQQPSDQRASAGFRLRSATLQRQMQRLSHSAVLPPRDAPTQIEMTGQSTIAEEEEDLPPEIARQDAGARRAWRRQRLAQREDQEYADREVEARNVDISRPWWRRVAGRVIPSLE